MAGIDRTEIVVGFTQLHGVESLAFIETCPDTKFMFIATTLTYWARWVQQKKSVAKMGFS